MKFSIFASQRIIRDLHHVEGINQRIYGIVKLGILLENFQAILPKLMQSRGIKNKMF